MTFPSVTRPKPEPCTSRPSSMSNLPRPVLMSNLPPLIRFHKANSVSTLGQGIKKVKSFRHCVDLVSGSRFLYYLLN